MGCFWRHEDGSEEDATGADGFDPPETESGGGGSAVGGSTGTAGGTGGDGGAGGQG